MTKERFFCAVNSGRGFVSFYPELIRRAEKVYIIKGGPGTGKSRFLSEIASAYEERGGRAEYYYCSSDPLSLDAVMIGKTLLLDGTAPHAVEASVPGARDEIIDLGRFWDPAKLIGNRKSIDRHAAAKSAGFERGYEFLAVADRASKVYDDIVFPALLPDKLRAAAERTVSRLPESVPCPPPRKVAVNSFGMRGEYFLDTFITGGSYVTVSDRLGTAKYYLSALIEAALKKGLTTTVAYDPLEPEFPDAVRFDSVNITYGKAPGGSGKTVNMRRFLDESVITGTLKKELRTAEKLRTAAIEAAVAAFSASAAHHFALEKIYGEAMDFAAKEKFTEKFKEELFSGVRTASL